MISDDETYKLEGARVVHTTPKDVLVRLDDLDEVWIPRSVCVDGDDLTEEDTDVSVQAWWAEKEGII